MHFLLTNDDGIHADGLRSLADAIRSLPGSRLTIVAPATEYSQCGHRVTTHEPIIVDRRAEDEYVIHGTPADCVRVALYGIGLRPDFVVSGINHGGNMGQDIFISGTVAAVREAAYHGLPAAAFSHYMVKGIAFDWPRLSKWTAELLRTLLHEPLTDGEHWNVNFPHIEPGDRPLPPLVRCQPARSPLRVAFAPNADGTEYRYTAAYATRPRDAGSDVEACFGGNVAVSRLSLRQGTKSLQ